jgi:hypothetical protein
VLMVLGSFLVSGIPHLRPGSVLMGRIWCMWVRVVWILGWWGRLCMGPGMRGWGWAWWCSRS